MRRSFSGKYVWNTAHDLLFFPQALEPSHSAEEITATIFQGQLNAILKLPAEEVVGVRSRMTEDQFKRANETDFEFSKASAYQIMGAELVMFAFSRK